MHYSKGILRIHRNWKTPLQMNSSHIYLTEMKGILQGVSFQLKEFPIFGRFQWQKNTCCLFWERLLTGSFGRSTTRKYDLTMYFYAGITHCSLYYRSHRDLLWWSSGSGHQTRQIRRWFLVLPISRKRCGEVGSKGGSGECHLFYWEMLVYLSLTDRAMKFN